VVQAVTRTTRFPQDPAAADHAAADPAAAFYLAAAPLAETPLAAAPVAAGPLTNAPLAGPMTDVPAAAGPIAAGPPAARPPGAWPPATERPPEPPSVVVPEPLLPPPETRLPIFESVESDWFRARRRTPRRGAAPVEPRRAGRSWTSPGDDGWRAAQAVLAPVTGGLTASGLPRRTPQANLVPGSAGAQDDRRSMPADTAEVMSGRLAGFQRGARRARAAAAPAPQPPVEPP
jgi:hypothetical protein